MQVIMICVQTPYNPLIFPMQGLEFNYKCAKSNCVFSKSQNKTILKPGSQSNISKLDEPIQGI